MNISIIGTGYVGLVSGTCFAEMGNQVICVDVDERKINDLKNGIIPIYEPGLEEMVRNNYKKGSLQFTLDIKEALSKTDLIFIAVGTPMGEDGSADLQYVLGVAKQIGQYMDHPMIVVDKSTVPVGTADRVRQTIKDELAKRNADIDFDVVSNPEFLKEGSAIKDFMSPDRVVVGVDSERAKELMTRLYRPIMLKSFRVIFTDIASAEMIKYAANSMLATRISFMNDIANLCELVGADVNMVRQGIGADTRIGSKFLYPGCGYGGSCFPKDVKALVKTAEKEGYTMKVLKAVEEVNEDQKKVLFKKLAERNKGGIEGRTIALWGLAFKPETDDMREATSLVIIDLLKKANCKIRVFDPVAMDECKRRVGDIVYYAQDMYDVVRGADALMMLTEWKQFRMPDWAKVSSMMKGRLVLDGRNIYDAAEMKRHGFDYACIGGK